MKKLRLFIICISFGLLFSGCWLEWGDRNTTAAVVTNDDIIDAQITATVTAVNGNQIEIETDTGLTYNVTIPDDETIDVDDAVEVTLEFEGNDANNDWFLMDIVFEERVL